MPVQGFPPTLEKILYTLFEESVLYSYKLCANQSGTTVILRFSNMEDNQQPECSQSTHFQSKHLFNSRPTRRECKNVFENSSEFINSTSSNHQIISSTPSVSQNQNHNLLKNNSAKGDDEERDSGIIGSLGLSYLSVPETDSSATNCIDKQCVLEHSRSTCARPNVSNPSVAEISGKTFGHTESDSQPVVSSTSTFDSQDQCDSQQHRDEDMDQDVTATDDPFDIGDSGTKPAPERMASDIFGDNTFLKKVTERLPNKTKTKLRNISRNRYFKRIADNTNKHTRKTRLIATTDDLLIQFDPVSKKVLDYSVISGMMNSEALRNLDILKSLPDLKCIDHKREVKMLKEATVDLLNFVSLIPTS